MSTPEPAYVTPRGFTGYADLTDRYGASLRVQGSSLATEPCVWIFAETGSAHLTVEQARTVRDALTNWLNEHTADRPSVTDDARAEAERRWGDRRTSDRLPSDWLDEGMASGFVLGAQWAAGRAETTTWVAADLQEAISENERLRTNLWALQEQDERAEIWREKANQYHARLAAVEALAAEWERENRRGPASDGPATAYLYECAADLRAALATDTTKETS